MSQPYCGPGAAPDEIWAAWNPDPVVLAALALLAAAAALNQVSQKSAELFAATRLAERHAGMYGAVDLSDADQRALLARALP